ncbi:MAG: HAD-IC family P-type ATPase, partial [Alphaproteobacteria bacterium]|nr:HAD-IC family P-type ATPase [Alphaproteobacteria bacterium]
MLDVHKLPLPSLHKELGSSARGLTEDEAARRLEQYGPNELRVRRDVPEFVKFLLQFKNFFALLLMVGGALAIYAERLDPGRGNLYIAIALLGVVLLNAVFTYIQELQSERIMDSFRQMLPAMVTVLRDGYARRVQAETLVVGDLILLHEGDRVPADGRLISASELEVDCASLTGESEPQRLNPEAYHENILESRNMVFSGTLVQSGEGQVLVCNTGMSTQIGSIVALTKATVVTETPIHKELNYFIKVISTIAIFLGVLFFLVSVATGNGAIASLIFAIGIIVANVPEGLLP